MTPEQKKLIKELDDIRSKTVKALKNWKEKLKRKHILNIRIRKLIKQHDTKTKSKD